MKGKKAEISGAELEIMKVLWKHGEPVNTQAINQAVAHKQWKRTTVSTLLTRLVEKGFAGSEKKGNSYFYTSLISKKEYRKAQTRNLIESLYQGSVKELAASLVEEGALSEEEIRELKALFKE